MDFFFYNYTGNTLYLTNLYSYFRFPSQVLKFWFLVALIKGKMKKKTYKNRIRSSNWGGGGGGGAVKPVQTVKDAEVEVHHREHKLWVAKRRQLCGWAFLFGNIYLKLFKLW